MQAILLRSLWLYPLTDQRLVLVVAHGGRFVWLPRLGFYGYDNKTYFVLSFGKIYAGMRLVAEID